MEKRLLEWLFVLAMGYIFVELQRVLTGTRISNGEWIGFGICLGLAIWLWHEGKSMDLWQRREDRFRQMLLPKRMS